MSLLGSIAKIGKSIIKSPITKAVAGGVAIVFPPVGVPALAGVVAAEQIIKATDDGAAAVKAVRSTLAPDKQNSPAAIKSALTGFPALRAKALAAQAAAQVVSNTKKLAASGDKNAVRSLAVLKVVQGAKRGDPKAKALLHQEIKKQVSGVIAAGSKPGATPAEKSMARVTASLVKATAARKVAARRFGINRSTARIVRVA